MESESPVTSTSASTSTSTSASTSASTIRQTFEPDYLKLIKLFDELKVVFNRDYGLTFEFHHRLKSVEGIKFKLENNVPLQDVIGFRLTNPWTQNLHLIGTKLGDHLKIISTFVAERGRVIYLFCETDSGNLFEVQLWTSVMYHCFEYEHDRVYKPTVSITTELKLKSKVIREEEHKLQDIIDEYVIFN